MNTDSAVPGLNRDMALSTEILVSPYKIRRKFDEICSCLMKKICYNSRQIGQVEGLQDSLLPRWGSEDINRNQLCIGQKYWLVFVKKGNKMEIEIFKPKSLSHYIEIIKQIKSTNALLWFRGHSNVKYKLYPSFFRIPQKFVKNNHARHEKEIFDRFTERSLQYLSAEMKDNWAWLFFMQHYGIPTRLLDWTESPLIALFFALENIIKNRQPKNDATVWVLNPIKWNRSVLSYQSFAGGVLSKNDEQLSQFSPPANFKSIPEYSLAMNGIYNSKRIAAQKGTFTIFGSSKCMEDYFNEKIDSPCLFNIVLQKQCLQTIKDELISCGITESVVYPDLDGLSREIKREFGCGV
jgi:hypothetical protein